MAAFQSPTVRRRRLGQELRQLREQAGFTLDEVAGRLEWSGSKVSRIETTKVKVRPRDVGDLLDLYGVTDPQHRDNVLTLARQALEQAWWIKYGTALSGLAEVWVGLEAEAVAARIYSVQIANGLLQTEEYARAVLKAIWASGTTAQIDQRVAVRMERQALLTREDPLQLWVVIEEAAIHREVGGPAVLRRQLLHLVEAAEMPNITLQVLPFTAGAHAGIDGPFNILELPAPDPDVVFVEHRVGITLLEQPEDVKQYNQIFDRLRATAISPEQSVSLIAKHAKDLEKR